MPLVKFDELMVDAERRGYAVGYFESWNLESLLAVADAAEQMRSPVILGVSGIYVPAVERVTQDPLGVYAAMGLAVCHRISVPACLLFNESPYLPAVLEAISLGFSLVMSTDESLADEDLLDAITQVVRAAHVAGVSVEGEMTPLPGVGGDLELAPDELRLTDPVDAVKFIEKTGVDALAVNVGQSHLHGRGTSRLDLDRVSRLKAAVREPLVLHGASSIDQESLAAAVSRGIRKVNVGSVLKQSYFNALRDACGHVGPSFNPYHVIGSGLEGDVLVAGRLAMQKTVAGYMNTLGSAGRARGAARKS
jgi:fructose/tagatose bisphosphate aldolase